MTGEKIHLSELIERFKDKSEAIDDPLQIDDNTFIDLDESFRLINHSCNPTAGIQNTNELIAIRDIEPGEEITYNYSTTVSIDNKWKMKCHCQSKECLKIIGNILSLPKEKVMYYYTCNALPQHIIRQLKNINYFL